MKEFRIRTALVSVYNKNSIDPLVKTLFDLNIKILSTGGTAKYIEEKGYEVEKIESITGYPSILGGRVKTLHPKVFGGVLYRREVPLDFEETEKYEIPPIDLVIVDLYPFIKTLTCNSTHEEIIEKIDIGGISLIRAASKNFRNVCVICRCDQYRIINEMLIASGGKTSLEQRKKFATEAFKLSSNYDQAIQQYLLGINNEVSSIQKSIKKTLDSSTKKTLRYGENPHQSAVFFGDLDQYIIQLQGKEISYNNLIDIEATMQLVSEFPLNTFAILKHNNASGVATDNNIVHAYQKCLAADPVSAFGGVLISNSPITPLLASEIDKLFFEVLICPVISEESLEILAKKRKRIIIQQKKSWNQKLQFKSTLNGILTQENDNKIEIVEDLIYKTKIKPTIFQAEDLLFANKISKHSKSNCIVLVRNRQMIASGVGQTSRVDALVFAIEKAKKNGFSLDGVVASSEAFFPFVDCVEIAHKAGIKAVIQPGGSIRDQESIDYCDENEMIMVFTNVRHFRH